MLQKAFAIMFVSSLIFTLGGGAARSVKAAETRRAVPCTAEQGQALIEEGNYEQAINKFTCVINGDPTGVEGYRGRIEALLLLRRYSDAVRDYQRVMAFVLPVHPDAKNTILAGYDARLEAVPESITALTGASAARWWFFDYASAIHLLNQLLAVRPNDQYGNLFRGSSRLLSGATKAKGVADIERAISLDPQNAHVRFIVADAYTYGLHDPDRAFFEATLALEWGLDTPRVHAILGAAYNTFGDLPAAADHIERSIDLVTTELVPTSPMTPGTTMNLDLIPGRTYEIPINATAGETISIATSSRDFWDTICVLVGPDGAPVIGSDDDNFYFAAFDYVAPVAGVYLLKVTSFESVNTGVMVVTRN